MFSNEASHLKPPLSVWQLLDRDTKSPLHRLYRLQSILKALHLALNAERATEGANLAHLESVAGYAFDESEHISGQLEDWLDKDTYISPAKTS